MKRSIFSSTDELLDKIINQERNNTFSWRDYIKDTLKITLNSVGDKMSIELPDEAYPVIEKNLDEISSMFIDQRNKVRK